MFNEAPSSPWPDSLSRALPNLQYLLLFTHSSVGLSFCHYILRNFTVVSTSDSDCRSCNQKTPPSTINAWDKKTVLILYRGIF